MAIGIDFQHIPAFGHVETGAGLKRSVFQDIGCLGDLFRFVGQLLAFLPAPNAGHFGPGPGWSKQLPNTTNTIIARTIHAPPYAPTSKVTFGQRDIARRRTVSQINPPGAFGKASRGP